MEDKKVSVIIPIYNTSRPIFEPCLNSVVKQTYRNIEIILVDDGSEMRCGRMIDDLADKDDRIRVFHQKNGGASAARNYGMDMATGNYLTFIDADDVVSPIMIEHGVRVAQETGAKLVIGMATRDVEPYMESAENKKEYFYKVLNADNILKLRQYYLTEYDAGQFFCNESLHTGVYEGPWCRIFSSELKVCKFDVGIRYNEDILWNFKLLGQENIRVSVVNEIWYYYRKHESSICHSYYEDRPFQLARSEYMLYKTFVSNTPTLKEVYASRLLRYPLRSLISQHLLKPECPLSWHEKRRYLHDFISENEPFNLLLTCPIPCGKSGIKILLLRSNLILEVCWLKMKLKRD